MEPGSPPVFERGGGGCQWAEVIAGPGRTHLRAARRLAASGGAVPVFVRRGTGQWEYVGLRRVAKAVDDPDAVGERAAEVAPAGGAVLLVLDDGGDPPVGWGGPAA